MSTKKADVVYRLSDQSAIALTLPQESTELTYPSQWFKKHPNKKPPIRIGLKDANLDNLYGAIAHCFDEGNLTAELAVAGLYHVFKDQKHKLSSKWESFGVTIGEADEEVTPWSIVDVELLETKLGNVSVKAGITQADANWIVFYLCFIYRYTRANHPEYKDQLYARANEHVKNINEKAIPINLGQLNKMRNLLLNDSYIKAIACIDMFYFKFKQSELTGVRFGTLSTRFKDCSALTTLNYITQVTGLSISKFILWVFSARMADEIARLATPNEELEKSDSYAAYMRELGLSDRSPYSTQANPAFSLFCHVVGTLLGSKRSKNAKMGAEVDTVNTVINAKIVAYVLSNRADLTVEFSTVKPEAPRDDKQDQMKVTEIGEIPESQDPEEWFAYLSSMGFKIPQEIEIWVRQRVNNLTDLRDGSVGKFLKSQC
ncbi:nucleocapsid protein [Wenzhou Rhinolophus pusillus ledantevirus 1]|uniref:nucleocapsid protein n=1 Tax=Wenzhou Rhinolophus pusillus ledantevirus 1 TaxID=2929007 RepID=UPI002481CB6A|nr:nucleocapsid protein [Wenzhou Rhinolophus pusillus ledantevirus 1]UOX72914.1 nucleocapsid protein [Wenzhou Rhinolophus pusillus ledantevirus 1]